MIDPLRAIAEQTGVFLRGEALQCGYDDRSLAVALRTQQIVRIRHGAYVFADVWSTLTPEERHLVLARAVVRQTPGPVALSHTTALIAHQVDVWGADLSRVHLTRLDAGPFRSQPDVVHHVGECPDTDIALVDGLATIAPARAVVESASLMSTESGLVVADSALHKALCDPDELHEVFARFESWPGTQRVHVVLHLMDGRAESAGESRSRYFFWRVGLPRPELQFHVYDERGVLVAVTDFVWHEQRLFGEFDGRIKYGRLLRPGETPGDAVFREKRREDLVREITGYGCGRLVWDDLARRRETRERFARLLTRPA